MNDSEVTMHDTRPPGDLTVYRTALDAAATAIALVGRVPAPLKSLADQVIRCASSVSVGARIHHWRIAFASAKEVDAHLRLLARAGAVDSSRAAETLELFDQVRAMTWRLLHPRP